MKFHIKEGLKGFIDTWMAVIETPSNFYEKMPTTGGYIEPLKFVVICDLPAAILIGILYGGILSYSFGIMGIIGFILFPALALLLGIIGAFIASILIDIGVTIFAGENKKPFESTFRIVSYSSAVFIVSWVPLLGSLIALYGIYLLIVGIKKVHKTSTKIAIYVIIFTNIVAIPLALVLT